MADQDQDMMEAGEFETMLRAIIRDELSMFFGHLPRRSVTVEPPKPNPDVEKAEELLDGPPNEVRNKIANCESLGVINQAIQLERRNPEGKRTGIFTLLEYRRSDLV